MKIFDWVQNKFNGRQGSQKSSGVSANRGSSLTFNHTVNEPRKDEFSDWPHGLLAIGTFGSNDLKEDPNGSEAQDNTSSSQDLQDFTHEEVGKLQKELMNLLSRRRASNGADSTREKDISDLPLDKFLNCPSSLEVERTNCIDSDDKNCSLQRNTSVLLSRGKDVLKDHTHHSNNTIGKRSISFLLKKMFVCRSGFSPAPSLRDPLTESRMEKILRELLYKKIYPQNSTPTSSTKKYLENTQMLKMGNEGGTQEKPNDGCKWVKTDSEYIVLEI